MEEDKKESSKVLPEADKDSLEAPAPLSIVEEARAERIKIEAALKETREVLARNEAAVAKIILGGKAEAGQSPIKTEETPKEYAEKVMAGKIKTS